jgi:Protein of unknown function (DUF2815)
MSKAAWFHEKLGEYITPRVRLAWVNVLTPKRIKDKPDSKPTFSANGLIPVGSDIKVLEDGLAEVAKVKHGAKWQANKKLLLPIDKTTNHDKLSEFAEEFPLYIKAKASEEYKPLIYVMKAGKMEEFKGEASEIYPGRWAVFGGTFYGYDNLSKGVNFGLNRVILLEHDERLALGGGARDSMEGFEGLGEGESASSMFD